MDKISSLLNDQNLSLDEVLACIDSTNFDLLMTEQEVDSTGEFGWVEIQDTFTSTLVALPDNQEIVQQRDRDPQIQDKDRLPSNLSRNAASCHLNSTVTPYKEHGRVRDRVIRLRGVVKQLEHQLECLNALKHQGHANESKLKGDTQNSKSNNVNNCTASSSGVEVVTWEQLALRQLKARRDAEKENMTLRERLQDQLRVARRLENLIQGQLPQQVGDLVSRSSGERV